MKVKRKMLIQCCSGIRNSGDEAILETLVRQYGEDWDITVISRDPLYTTEMHEKVKTCGDHRSCCHAVRSCDVFVLGGGGLLQDETTVYNVARWLRYLRLAIRLGKPTAVYANSVGPLRWRINRFLVKRYLNRTDLITLRDEESAQLLERLGVRSRTSVTADAVFSFPVRSAAPQREEGGYVCMALRHWYDTHPFIPVAVCSRLHIRSRKNRRKYGEYIRTMAAVTDYINRVWKKKVVFVSFLYGRDGAVARDILGLVNSGENEIIEEEYMAPERVMDIIGGADLLVGMRLHSIIYGICTSTPVLPVVYSDKVRGMVRMNRLERYCVSMEELQPGRVIRQLELVWEERALQKTILKEQFEIMREKEKENKELLGKLTEKSRIVMIGPVFPYKGGISHYTGLMCRALRKVYDVTMVSYKMQYPKILFKREQRDNTNDSFAVEDTKYWINTANPFNILSSAGRIRREKPDLIILQWWHPYFAPCYRILIKSLKRHGKGLPVLMVCHNVYPHERFPLDRFLTGYALKGADYYLVQSGKDEADLLGIVKNAKYKRVVHPTYDHFNMSGMSKEEARARLGLPKEGRVILFFGFVRKYKGLHHLLKAMPEITARLPDLKLLVAGDFGDSRQEYLDEIEKLQLSEHIVLSEGYCPDAEVEKYFSASTLVVLPYEEATQSGIAQIAFGFRKPVIATDVGGLPEVVTDGRTGYIVPPLNPKMLADAVIRFFEEDREEEFVRNIEEESERFSWQRIVGEIEELTGSGRRKNE